MSHLWSQLSQPSVQYVWQLSYYSFCTYTFDFAFPIAELVFSEFCLFNLRLFLPFIKSHCILIFLISLWSYLADNMVSWTGLLYITYIHQRIYPVRWPILCDGRSETQLSPTTVSLLQESSWAQTQSTGTLQKCTGSRNVNRVEWLQLCKVHRIFCPNVPPSGEEHFYLPHPSPHVWGCDAWL